MNCMDKRFEDSGKYKYKGEFLTFVLQYVLLEFLPLYFIYKLEKDQGPCEI